MNFAKKSFVVAALAACALAGGAALSATDSTNAQSSTGSTELRAVGPGCDITNLRSARLASACQWASGGAGIIVSKDGDGGQRENGPVMAP